MAKAMTYELQNAEGDSLGTSNDAFELSEMPKELDMPRLSEYRNKRKTQTEYGNQENNPNLKPSQKISTDTKEEIDNLTENLQKNLLDKPDLKQEIILSVNPQMNREKNLSTNPKVVNTNGYEENKEHQNESRIKAVENEGPIDEIKQHGNRNKENAFEGPDDYDDMLRIDIVTQLRQANNNFHPYGNYPYLIEQMLGAEKKDVIEDRNEIGSTIVIWFFVLLFIMGIACFIVLRAESYVDRTDVFISTTPSMLNSSSV